MKWAEDHNKIPDKCFGSRRGRSAVNAAINWELAVIRPYVAKVDPRDSYGGGCGTMLWLTCSLQGFDLFPTIGNDSGSDCLPLAHDPADAILFMNSLQQLQQFLWEMEAHPSAGCLPGWWGWTHDVDGSQHCTHQGASSQRACGSFHSSNLKGKNWYCSYHLCQWHRLDQCGKGGRTDPSHDCKNASHNQYLAWQLMCNRWSTQTRQMFVVPSGV